MAKKKQKKKGQTNDDRREYARVFETFFESICRYGLIIADDNLQKADSTDLKSHHDATPIAIEEADKQFRLLSVDEKEEAQILLEENAQILLEVKAKTLEAKARYERKEKEAKARYERKEKELNRQIEKKSLFVAEKEAQILELDALYERNKKELSDVDSTDLKSHQEAAQIAKEDAAKQLQLLFAEEKNAQILEAKAK